MRRKAAAMEEDGGKNNEKAIDDSEEDNEERVLMESSAESFFPALTKITVALGPNSGSITDADYHHETLDNLQIVKAITLKDDGLATLKPNQ
ncbi:hypothetical protein YC2023_046117 [Brassica napus]